ncbi:unnamed protein product, partial [Meganyctiphanes norvegica]
TTSSNRNNIRNSNIKSKLRCLNTNAQSLQFKMAELEDVIKKDDVQIITITESWGQTWKEASLEIEGFNMYKKYRADGRRGGGCLIYVSKELKSYACKQMENVPGDDSVWCWVKVADGARILV